MIYGLWKSATGVMTANYKQSVITNNLANSETTGFKKDLVMTQQRRLAAQELPGMMQYSSRFHDRIGGGTLLSPTSMDMTQGTLENTDGPLDVGIAGSGYFAVRKDGEVYLTRNGNFMLDKQGNLILGDGSNAQVLDEKLKPIQLDPSRIGDTTITATGMILQKDGASVQLAIKKAERGQLQKDAQQLFAVKGIEPAALPTDDQSLLRVGMLERSNVDTPAELVELIETQRLLEANANMIRFQDQLLGRLVTDVGKI